MAYSLPCHHTEECWKKSAALPKIVLGPESIAIDLGKRILGLFLIQGFSIDYPIFYKDCDHPWILICVGARILQSILLKNGRRTA